jgi:hypothetical protein
MTYYDRKEAEFLVKHYTSLMVGKRFNKAVMESEVESLSLIEGTDKRVYIQVNGKDNRFNFSKQRDSNFEKVVNELGLPTPEEILKTLFKQ